jgi:hypothetical protein
MVLENVKNLGRLREGFLRNGNINHKMKVESDVSLMAKVSLGGITMNHFKVKLIKLAK